MLLFVVIVVVFFFAFLFICLFRALAVCTAFHVCRYHTCVVAAVYLLRTESRMPTVTKKRSRRAATTASAVSAVEFGSAITVLPGILDTYWFSLCCTSTAKINTGMSTINITINMYELCFAVWS